MVGSSPYLWRKSRPANNLSRKILNGTPPFGTLTVTSIIILYFHDDGTLRADTELVGLLEGRREVDVAGVVVVFVRSDAGVLVEVVAETASVVGAGDVVWVDGAFVEAGVENLVVLRRTCTEFKFSAGVAGMVWLMGVLGRRGRLSSPDVDALVRVLPSEVRAVVADWLALFHISIIVRSLRGDFFLA
jgi:hypothetical protein